MRFRHLMLFVFAFLIPAAPLHAQRMDNSLRAQDTTRTLRATWRPMRIVKWTSLLASGGAAAYGTAGQPNDRRSDVRRRQ